MRAIIRCISGQYRVLGLGVPSSIVPKGLQFEVLFRGLGCRTRGLGRSGTSVYYGWGLGFGVWGL